MVRISYYKGLELFDAKARHQNEAIEILAKELSVPTATIAGLHSRYVSIKQSASSKTIDFDGMVEDMDFLTRVAAFFKVLCGVKYCADPLTGKAFSFLQALPESRIKQHFLSRSRGLEPSIICEEEAAKFALIFSMDIQHPEASESLSCLPMGLLLNTLIVARDNNTPLDHFITETKKS